MIDVSRLDFNRALDGVSRSIETVSLAEQDSAKTIQKGTERVSGKDRKHDTRNMIVGWVAGVVSSLLVSLITGLALSIGLPMK